jgi:Tol biopolymer transport system component
MNPDGSNQIQLTKDRPKFYPSISGDGKWVLYNTTDDLHLWKVSVEGGEPIEVAKYVAIRPAMSPDERTIACFGRNELKREILILPASGGQPFKRIEVRDARPGGYRIKWTADGKALIYIAENDGRLNLMKQSLDGKAPEKVAEFDQYDLFDFDYSADGQFAVTRGVWKWDVVLINDLN